MEPETFTVYRIDTYEAGSNSHTVGIRQENWYLRKDSSFPNEETAKAYVREKNRQCSDLPLLLISMTEEKKLAFIDEFCFGDSYWSIRRYFLGLPPKNKILKDLQEQRIVIQGFKSCRSNSQK